MATSSPPMSYFPNAQKDFKPPLIANENAFLGDIASTSNLTEDAPTATPLSSGFFRLESGTPLSYTYTYHEMKIILEGSFDIEDEGSGKKVKGVPGDVFYFPKGSKIKFQTEERGLAFFVGGRGVGEI